MSERRLLSLTRNPWRTACLGTAVFTLLLLAVGVGTAVTWRAAAATDANKGAKKLSVVQGSDLMIPDAFQEIGSTTITIPSRQTGLILVRFSGESICNFGDAGTRCDVRITVSPPAGQFREFVFDSDDTGDNYPESHAVEAAFGPLTPGTYTVSANGRVIGSAGTTFSMQDWTLAVELWRVT